MEGTKLIEMLFGTEAFRVAPADKPFWYTSGKIGPFYINTHFLYGSEAEAQELLAEIDAITDQRELTAMLERTTSKHYKSNKLYKTLIDDMVSYIRKCVDIDDVDFITGGARRDWFFSVQCARLLQKEHIYIFKDCTCILGSGEMSVIVEDEALSGVKCLHIADLVTEASSYVRAWVPTIERIGGVITDTVAVVDRRQGGAAALKKLGVNLHTMLQVSNELFVKANEMGLIDEEQLAMLQDYERDPDGCMSAFVSKNPQFIKDALDGLAGERIRERARLCVDKNWYNY